MTGYSLQHNKQTCMLDLSFVTLQAHSKWFDITVSFHVFSNQWFSFFVPAIFNRTKIRKKKKKCQVRRNRKWLFKKWKHKRMLKKIENILRLKSSLENNKPNKLFFILQEHIPIPSNTLVRESRTLKKASILAQNLFCKLTFSWM